MRCQKRGPGLPRGARTDGRGWGSPRGAAAGRLRRGLESRAARGLRAAGACPVASDRLGARLSGEPSWPARTTSNPGSPRTAPRMMTHLVPCRVEPLADLPLSAPLAEREERSADGGGRLPWTQLFDGFFSENLADAAQAASV